MTKTPAASPRARPVPELPRSPFETTLDIFGAMGLLFTIAMIAFKNGDCLDLCLSRLANDSDGAGPRTGFGPGFSADLSSHCLWLVGFLSLQRVSSARGR